MLNIRSRMTYANCAATLALFLALSGGTVLARTLVTGADIKDHSILGKDIAANSIGAGQIGPNAIDPTEVSAVPSALITPALSANERPSIASSDSTLYYPLVFTREAWDPRGMHSPSKNPARLTAKVAGLYRVTLNVLWQGSRDGLRGIQITGDGGVYVRATQAPIVGEELALGTTIPVRTGQSITTLVNLDVGNYVEASAWQSSGAALQLAGLLPSDSNFSATWEGPLEPGGHII